MTRPCRIRRDERFSTLTRSSTPASPRARPATRTSTPPRRDSRETWSPRRTIRGATRSPASSTVPAGRVRRATWPTAWAGSDSAATATREASRWDVDRASMARVSPAATVLDSTTTCWLRRCRTGTYSRQPPGQDTSTVEAVDCRASSGLAQAGMRRAGSRLASPSPPGTAPTAAARIDSTGWNEVADAQPIGRASRKMRTRRGQCMRGAFGRENRPGSCKPRARVPAQASPRPADTACMTHNLLNRIDQRTRLAGHNRLALLLFRLGGRQLFGVNVFKVQEVLRRPPLFQLPGLPSQFAGAADVRGRSVPVLDLGVAIGHPERMQPGEEGTQYLVVTEFNRSV